MTQGSYLQLPDQQLDHIFEQYAAGRKMKIADDELARLTFTGERKLDGWRTGDMQVWMANWACSLGMPLVDQQLTPVTIEHAVAIEC